MQCAKGITITLRFKSMHMSFLSAAISTVIDILRNFLGSVDANMEALLSNASAIAADNAIQICSEVGNLNHISRICYKAAVMILFCDYMVNEMTSIYWRQ